MRILHIIHSLDPRSGGPSGSLRRLAATQAGQGHSVQVVATDVQSAEPWAPAETYRQRLQGDAELAGCELHIVSAYGRRRPFSRYSYAPRLRRLLRSLLNGPERPDVIHIHGVFSHITSTAASLAARFGIPYLLRPAGALDADCLTKGNHLLKRAFIQLYLSSQASRAAALHATSSVEAEHLVKLFPGVSVVTIPHGVHVPAPLEIASSPPSSTDAQASPQSTIACISRLHPIKRLELALHVTERLTSTHPDVQLVLAGNDAGAGSNLRKLATDLGIRHRVHFPGFLDEAQKPRLLQQAAVFLQCSEHENLGLSVLEAMANACPVVTVPTVAAHAFVLAARAGIVTDSTADQLAEAIRQVLAEPRERFGEAGRRYVLENLTWPEIARRIESAYVQSMNGLSVCHAC